MGPEFELPKKYRKEGETSYALGPFPTFELLKYRPEQARRELMKIKGVGAKVAECSLLYGFGRVEAFPVDVWVKRVMEELYPNGLPLCAKNFEGIAQQYLFHWRRNRKEQKI